MTPDHDHATLFVAPRQPGGKQAADKAQPAGDHGAETMHRLRHPFAVRGLPATVPAR